MRALIVTIPFGDYDKGAMITEAADIKSALESHPAHVTLTTVEKTVTSDDPHAQAHLNEPTDPLDHDSNGEAGGSLPKSAHASK